MFSTFFLRSYTQIKETTSTVSGFRHIKKRLKKNKKYFLRQTNMTFRRLVNLVYSKEYIRERASASCKLLELLVFHTRRNSTYKKVALQGIL